MYLNCWTSVSGKAPAKASSTKTKEPPKKAKKEPPAKKAKKEVESEIPEWQKALLAKVPMQLLYFEWLLYLTDATVITPVAAHVAVPAADAVPDAGSGPSDVAASAAAGASAVVVATECTFLPGQTQARNSNIQTQETQRGVSKGSCT